MKLNLNRLLSGFRSVQKFNANYDLIESAIENTVSRDGTGPNQMNADLDLNNNQIHNLGVPQGPNDAARLVDVITGTVDLGGLAQADLGNVTNEDFYDKGIEAGLGGGGGGGGGPTAWTDITGKPSTFPPTTPIAQASITGLTSDLAGKAGVSHTHSASSVTDFTEAAQDVVGAMVVAGANMTVTYNDASGTLTLSSAGGGGGSGPIVSIKDYGAATGNDSTDNKAFFDAAEADGAVERIYLPEGTYYTTNVLTDFKKNYWGPGKIRISAGDFLPGHFTNVVTTPTQYPVQGVTGWFRGDTSHFEPQYVRIAQNVRRGLTERYFEGSIIPRNVWLTTGAGWSGLTSRLNQTRSPGNTTAILTSAAGITNGDVLGFCQQTGVGGGLGATILDTVTVTNVSSNTITFTPALANSYTVGAVVTHGTRTNHSIDYYFVRNSGGGDAYGSVIRLQQNYVPLAGQTHVFETSTAAQYGGSIEFTQPGSAATGWESQYLDAGNDVQVIGQVDSFVRNNDTGARSAVWLGTLLKSEGSTPADAAHVVAGMWRVGVDLVRGTYNSAAIQMATGHKIVLNSTANSTSGRGSDPAAHYPVLWGNTVGDSYIAHGSDGTSPFVDIFCGSTYRLKIRNNATMSFNGSFSATGGLNTAGNIVASGTIDAGSHIVAGGAMSAPAGYYVSGNQVVGARQAAIANMAGGEALFDTQVKINEILNMLKTHGLIAT